MKGKQSIKVDNSAYFSCLIMHTIRFFNYRKTAGLGSEQTSDVKNSV